MRRAYGRGHPKMADSDRKAAWSGQPGDELPSESGEPGGDSVF